LLTGVDRISNTETLCAVASDRNSVTVTERTPVLFYTLQLCENFGLCSITK